MDRCFYAHFGLGDRLGHPENQRSQTARSGSLTPDEWFQAAAADLRAQITQVTITIAASAAALLPVYGSGDPGDCFIVATAVALNLRLMTRDALMFTFAVNYPDRLQVIRC